MNTIPTKTEFSPTRNITVLGQSQVDEFRTYLGNIKRNTIDMSRSAYEIHSQYIGANRNMTPPSTFGGTISS